MLTFVGRAADPYHLITKLSIPGDYGWDYLTADTEGRRLYVSHDREVVVVDLDTNAIIGKIPGKSIHGIAIAREFGRGFISCSDPGSILIFDLKNLKVLDRVVVGDDPNGIIFDQKTKRVFSADRGSKRVTAIDAATGKVAGTIENLGGRTEHLASDDAGHVFLNMQDRHTLLRLDSQALKVLDTWPLAPCEQPSSMDMDRKTERVFIGCRSGVMAVVDGNSGTLVTTQAIGRGVDATEFDPQRGLIFFSTGGGAGAVSVFHEDSPDKYTLIEEVKTQAGARTMATDRKTGKLYLSVAQFGPRPEPRPATPQPRPAMVPGSFSVLVFGK
ncbi:MAG TPA: YncE family protein [Terriglobia bacterium]|nr:YncE family protein [Terriglobia bacterium]